MGSEDRCRVGLSFGPTFDSARTEVRNPFLVDAYSSGDFQLKTSAMRFVKLGLVISFLVLSACHSSSPVQTTEAGTKLSWTSVNFSLTGVHGYLHHVGFYDRSDSFYSAPIAWSHFDFVNGRCTPNYGGDTIGLCQYWQLSPSSNWGSSWGSMKIDTVNHVIRYFDFGQDLWRFDGATIGEICGVSAHDIPYAGDPHGSFSADLNGSQLTSLIDSLQFIRYGHSDKSTNYGDSLLRVTSYDSNASLSIQFTK
jgi:hypothetical protein